MSADENVARQSGLECTGGDIETGTDTSRGKGGFAVHSIRCVRCAFWGPAVVTAKSVA